MNLHVGKIIQVKGVDYTHDGLGVAKYDSHTIFVQNLIIGEEAYVEITLVKRNFLVGKIKKILHLSPDRIKPLCPVASACGGCQFHHLSYDKELEYKKSKVLRAFHNNAHLDPEVSDLIGSDVQYYYRNKIIMPLGLDKKGRIIHGFYKQRTHEIVAIDNCYIEDRRSSAIIETIKDLMTKYGYLPYDEETHKGEIRKVMIRTSLHYGQVMVVLITSKKNIKGFDLFTKELLNLHQEITTLIQNINCENTNVVLGKEEVVLFGPGKIQDRLMGLEFNISSKSFYQVNPIQTEKLYKKAIEYAELSKNDVVLDAYSGIGTIGMSMAHLVKKVIGVEVVKQAVIDAKENAKSNHINNVEYFEDDASDFIAKLLMKKQQLDVVFVDPPRKGLDPKFVESLITLKAPKIVYISCDPATLARDVGLLSPYYEIKKLAVVDMFSRTFHVETVVALSLKK